MVSICKKRQSNRRLLSDLGDFDQDIFVGNTMSDRQEKATVNEVAANQEFTVNNSGSNSAANENLVSVKTFERCFNERIAREIANFVDTAEDRIQNAILTAIDGIITPDIELEIRLISASPGLDATSFMANSERGEHIGISAS